MTNCPQNYDLLLITAPLDLLAYIPKFHKPFTLEMMPAQGLVVILSQVYNDAFLILWHTLANCCHKVKGAMQ